MKTNDVLNKHEQRFRRSRKLVKVSLAMVALLIIILQYDHILSWLKGG